MDSWFVARWLIAHCLAWPLGVGSGAWIGWWWLHWLIDHVPGRHQLWTGFWPSHDHLGALLLLTFCLGGAIVGGWVGGAQWLLLRAQYAVPVSWIGANVVIWAGCAILLRLGMQFAPANLLYPLLVVVAGGVATGYGLERRLPPNGRLLAPVLPQLKSRAGLNRGIHYRLVFLGLGFGLATTAIVAPFWL